MMRSSYKRRRRRKMWKKIRSILLIISMIILIIALIIGGYNYIRFRDKTETEKQVLKHPWRYPKELITLMKENPETQYFVAGYNKNREKPLKILLSKKEIETKIPHFFQWDRRFGYTTYNENYFAITGSAPTCLSMVSVALSKNPLATPVAIAQYIEEHHYLVANKLDISFMTDGISYFDIEGESIKKDLSTIKDNLSNKKFIIAQVSGETFLSMGQSEHYIVLYKIDHNDKVYILDPNSKKNSDKVWDYSELSSMIQKVWVYTSISS